MGTYSNLEGRLGGRNFGENMQTWPHKKLIYTPNLSGTDNGKVFKSEGVGTYFRGGGNGFQGGGDLEKKMQTS